MTEPTRVASDSTPGEFSAGGRKPRRTGATEMLHAFFKKRDVVGAVYVFAKNVAIVEHIIIDGWPMLRELLRLIRVHTPEMADLLKQINSLHTLIATKHPKLRNVTWLFELPPQIALEPSNSEGETNETKKLKSVSVKESVVCDELLQQASKSGDSAVFGGFKEPDEQTDDEKHNRTVGTTTPLSEELFVNIFKRASVVNYLRAHLTTRRAVGKIGVNVLPDEIDDLDQDSKRMIEPMIRRVLATEPVNTPIMVLSFRDKMVTVCLGDVVRTSRHLFLQGRRSKLNIQNLVRVINHWGSFFGNAGNQFVTTFTALFEMTRHSIRERLGSFPHIFDLWVCSQNFIKSPRINERKEFIDTYKCLLQLTTANFLPTPLILTKKPFAQLEKPQAHVQDIDPDAPRAGGFSRNLRAQLNRLVGRPDIDELKVEPTNELGYDLHKVRVWLSSPIFQDPPTLAVQWESWLSTFRLKWPSISTTANQKSNKDFATRMIRFGAPWPEIVEAMAYEHEVRGQVPFRSARIEPHKFYTGDGSASRVSLLNKFVGECKSNPWVNAHDLFSFEDLQATLTGNESGWLTFASDGKDEVFKVNANMTTRYVPCFLRDIVFVLYEHRAQPSGTFVPHHVSGDTLNGALAISQTNLWFITVQFPWIANYAANAWQAHYFENLPPTPIGTIIADSRQKTLSEQKNQPDPAKAFKQQLKYTALVDAPQVVRALVKLHEQTQRLQTSEVVAEESDF